MISVILPCHNHEHLLKRNIKKWCDYLNPINGTLIIADDASFDSTKDYVQTHFPAVHYFKNSFEKGPISTLNSILPNIQTPYILVSDPALEPCVLNFENIISFVH